jgi:hypothetical protein
MVQISWFTREKCQSYHASKADGGIVKVKIKITLFTLSWNGPSDFGKSAKTLSFQEMEFLHIFYYPFTIVLNKQYVVQQLSLLKLQVLK